MILIVVLFCGKDIGFEEIYAKVPMVKRALYHELYCFFFLLFFSNLSHSETKNEN